MKIMRLKEELDRLYLYYNDRKFVHPDPLEFLYDYDDIKDREIAGLVASSLAYGRVTQILKSVALVLSKMLPAPLVFLRQSSEDSIYRTYYGFKHRFTTGTELSCLLVNIKNVITKYGSLNACFNAGLRKEDKTVLDAALSFANKLNASQEKRCNSLMPSPVGGSAFKRLNLYLRWMVRRDRVDPGGWDNISRSKLIIPLDTHMYRTSLRLGLTKRKQSDIRTAMEITDSFRRFDEKDPVKYDFALTRLGINKIEHTLLKECIN
jgi:uncharacterized protein (TIGR02757 family)